MYDSIVGADSLNPLDELKILDQQVDQIADLAGLKPIFFRADELGRLHSGDFEVQLAVGELKQRLVDRGRFLKQAPETLKMPSPPPRINIPAAPAPVPPPLPQAEPAPPPVPAAFQGPPAEEEPSPKVPIPASPMRPASAGAWPTGSIPTGPVATGPTVPGGPTTKAGDAGLSPVAPPPIPGAPAGPAQPPRTSPGGGGNSWKRPLLVGALVGATITVTAIVLLVNQARKKNLGAGGVQIQVATNPPGASVRINGEPMCTSNCSVSMLPGNYQITAFLDGYEAAASNISVEAGKPAAVSLALDPQAQSVRVLTDLDQGKIAFDDQPPADLQEGQFVFEKVPPGRHTVKVTSRTGEASFNVEIFDAKQPVVTGPVAARNLIAVLVSSLGSKAHVVTNSGPWKLSLNGQGQADVSPAGVDLNNFQPGVDEIVVGEGRDQRNMKESFGPAPMLTAFLKSDLNIGTLIISTGEDDVRVFLNNKEYARKTQRGQVRVQTIGAVSVRVAKDGFEALPPQTADVKKGSEVRVEFKMQALPQLAILQIRGATPGAEVLLDDKTIGTVGDDGGLTSSGVKPGDHTVELRRERFAPKRLQRSFRAGQTVALNGADVVLAAAMGIVKLTRTPPDAAVVYHRADEAQTHELRENQLELAPGTYVFTARAPGFTERSERLQVNAGETHPMELALAKVVAVTAPPPAPKAGGMADFEDPSAWSMQNGLWTHKGGGFIPYKPSPNGTFTFTIQLLRGGNLFRGGRIRWAVQYQDAKNYDLFELDKKYLSSKVIIAGKTYERDKHEHGLGEKEKAYTIQIEAGPEKLVHRLQNGDNWLVLDTWMEPGRDFTQGKFGFWVQGNDEIGLSDFKFAPK
ncbi:MAG TPA: PEGA domain-containing protein [Bryobacteraceae bacterium]|nr:PEGA domain-containing protein [Bryobacteraceae bacterium]